jgi:hypothetical protein
LEKFGEIAVRPFRLGLVATVGTPFVEAVRVVGVVVLVNHRVQAMSDVSRVDPKGALARLQS